MNGLMKTLNLLFVTVVGGLLVLYIQENYLSPSSIDGVSATATTGPWAPRQERVSNEAIDLSTQWNLLEDNNSLARLVIENRGPKTLTKANIRFKKDPALPDVLVVNGPDRKGVFRTEVEEVVLPTLQPGDEITIFIWNQYGFGWPSFLDEMRIYSELGEIPVSVTTHIDESGYGDADRLDSFWESALAYWWLILRVLGMIMFLLTLLTDWIWRSYTRKLLVDDDFWLSERQRIEDIGYRKFTPRTSDLEISPRLLSKFDHRYP